MLADDKVTIAVGEHNDKQSRVVERAALKALNLDRCPILTYAQYADIVEAQCRAHIAAQKAARR